MAFFREKFSRLTNLWTVVSASISQYGTKRLAKDIEKESTVSHADVTAVLTALPTVMRRYLAEGHTVKLDGIGIFKVGFSSIGLDGIGSFTMSAQCTKTGVADVKKISANQITNVKVQFRPEMESTGRKGKRRNVLVAEDLEWTYLPATKKTTDGEESEGDPSTGSGTEEPNGGSGTGGDTPGGNGGNGGNGGGNGGNGGETED